MRLPNPQKRQQIVAIAAKLFANRPFHEVRLDDVAAAANVGKGTLYVYFASKDDLYLSIIYEGFADVVGRLKAQLADEKLSAPQRLEAIVRQLVESAFQHPQVYELMRRMGPPTPSSGWRRLFLELLDLIESAIRLGVRRGELCDPNPRLTAAFIPGMVRSAVRSQARDLTAQALTQHILRLLHHGIGGNGRGGRTKPSPTRRRTTTGR
jgi:AcrR family transcriptional regulator